MDNYPEQILWCVKAKRANIEGERQAIFELAWGWTAGMSEEQIENCAEDTPKSYNYILTSLHGAISLRDQLNILIEEGLANPPKLSPEQIESDKKWNDFFDKYREDFMEGGKLQCQCYKSSTGPKGCCE